MITNSPKPRIFANAVPEKIAIHEQYTYKINISATPDTEFKDARGDIEIEVPYDGDICFSKESIHNLEETTILQNEAKPTSGLIGHLALGAPYNWETDLSRPVKPIFYPIHIPLETGGFNKKQWDTDQWRVRITEAYHLSDIHFPPIEIEIELFDDAISSPGTSFEEFIQQRLNKNVLEGAVVFDLAIRIPLPQMIERDGISVLIEEVELAWPSIAAPWQMSCFLFETKDGKGTITEKPWQFDLKRRAILLKNIPTERQANDPQSPLAYYKCHLQLLMMLPGVFVPGDSDLINSRLSGKVRAHIENLLISGREAAWMRVDGHLSKKAPPKLELRTEIQAEFSAFLAERCTNRSLTTFRQWIFPGVNLTEARVSDVAAALQDIGYHLFQIKDGRTAVLKLSGDVLESAEMVVGKASQVSELNELAKMRLEIFLKRIATGTTARERDLKGIIVSTNLPTSDLMIQLRGTMSVAGSLLDRDTAQLMNLLSTRFANVADLR